MQLYLESAGRIRNVSLVSAGRGQSHVGWHRLAVALNSALKQVTVVRNYRGFSLLVLGTFLAGVIVGMIVDDPEAAVRSLIDLISY